MSANLPMNSGIPEQIKQAIRATLVDNCIHYPDAVKLEALTDSLLTALAPHFTQQGEGQDSANMRVILKGLLDDAKSEAGDVLSDPTWNMDYLFGFKLTVKQLREIDAFLTSRPKPNRNDPTELTDKQALAIAGNTIKRLNAELAAARLNTEIKTK